MTIPLYQAQYAIPDLPPGTTPTGAELVEVVQNGESVQLALSQIASLVVSGAVPPIRLPAVSATVAILPTDIEVGIVTFFSAVTATLPSAAVWASTFPGGKTGLDLCIIDRSGNASANNITFSLSGGDTFLQGVSPVIVSAYGALRLRPYGNPTVTGWYIRGLG